MEILAVYSEDAGGRYVRGEWEKQKREKEQKKGKRWNGRAERGRTDLLDVEPCSDVYEHGVCGGEVSGDVERGGKGDEEFFPYAEMGIVSLLLPEWMRKELQFSGCEGGNRVCVLLVARLSCGVLLLTKSEALRFLSDFHLLFHPCPPYFLRSKNSNLCSRSPSIRASTFLPSPPFPPPAPLQHRKNETPTHLLHSSRPPPEHY